MKAIMLSVRPKYVSMILNKTKTIEVRKRFPKDYKGWVYIYCTKDNDKKHTLYRDNSNEQTNFYIAEQWKVKNPCWLNGRVVARFYCDKVTEYINGGRWNDDNTFGSYDDYIKDNVCGEACITEEELDNYCEDLAFSAIHISQLEIFDEPKELSEFKQEWYDCGNNFHSKSLTKAPQNYCYVEVEE